VPALTDPAFGAVSASADEERRLFVLRRGDIVLAVNFGDQPVRLPVEGSAHLLFGTPNHPELRDGALQLPPHGAALVGPSPA
jgi:maltooligosyltrehalose trehalohydrolase